MPTPRFIADDGTPEYCIMAEALLVGGAMLSPRDYLPALDPADFHTHDLATIWQAILDSHDDPSVPTIAELLAARGRLDAVGAEPRLAALASDPLAWLYAGRAAMAAHAGIIREWGIRRRILAQAQETIRGAMSGRDPSRGIGGVEL